MFTFSESASGITLQSPVWLGLLVLGLGIALAIYVVRGKATGKAFGAGIASLICIAFGWHLLYAKVRFDDTGVFVRGGTGVSAVAAWSEIRSARYEQRSVSRGGRQTFLVIDRVGGPEIEIQVGALMPESEVRLLDYVREKAGLP